MQLSSPAMQPLNTVNFAGKRARQAAAAFAIGAATLGIGATAAAAEDGAETPNVQAEDLRDFGQGDTGSFTLVGDNATLPINEGDLTCEASQFPNIEPSGLNVVDCEPKPWHADVSNPLAAVAVFLSAFVGGTAGRIIASARASRNQG